MSTDPSKVADLSARRRQQQRECYADLVMAAFDRLAATDRQLRAPQGARHPVRREMDTLLPCPFCGSTAARVDLCDGENAGGTVIACTHCDACSAVHFNRKENLVSDWNRRWPAPSPDVREIVDGVLDLFPDADVQALRCLAELMDKQRRLDLQAAEKAAEGWEVEAAGDTYMTSGNGNFWDPGTNYDQGRHDAAAAIRAIASQSSPPATGGDRHGA